MKNARLDEAQAGIKVARRNINNLSYAYGTRCILEPPKIKSVTVSIVSPSICHEVIGLDAMIFIFCMLTLSQLFHSLLYGFQSVKVRGRDKLGGWG